MDEVVELVVVIPTSIKIIENGVRMKKLSPFSYYNFCKLKFLLRTFVGVNQMGGGFLVSFGRIIPPPPRFFG
jgi:hypothetical protein